MGVIHIDAVGEKRHWWKNLINSCCVDMCIMSEIDSPILSSPNVSVAKSSLKFLEFLFVGNSKFFCDLMEWAFDEFKEVMSIVIFFLGRFRIILMSK